MVVSLSHMDRHGGSMWNCLCDCGAKKIISGNGLIRGLVVSCKCLHREQLGNLRRTARARPHLTVQSLDRDDPTMHQSK